MPYMCLLAVLGSQGIVVKCAAAIFSVQWIDTNLRSISIGRVYTDSNNRCKINIISSSDESAQGTI